MAPDKLAPKVFRYLCIVGYMRGTFPIPPHTTDIVVARELMAAFFAAVDMSLVNSISKGFCCSDSYIVDIANMIRESVKAYRIWEIVNLSELLSG